MGRPWPKRLTGRPGPFPPCATPPLGLHKSRFVSPVPSRMKSRAKAVAVDLLRKYHRQHRSRLGRRPSGGVTQAGSEAGMPSQRRWARDGPSARPDGVAPERGNPAGAQPGASGLVTLPRQSNPARRGSEPLPQTHHASPDTPPKTLPVSSRIHAPTRPARRCCRSPATARQAASTSSSRCPTGNKCAGDKTYWFCHPAHTPPGAGPSDS